jgi:hypothetical protein
MASVVELQRRRDKLFAAMTSGARKVDFGDREIEYRSLNEMKQALAMLDAEIAGGGQRGPSFSIGHFVPRG